MLGALSCNQNSHMNDKEDKKAPTLFDFIEENQRLVTVLGVFTALTVFAGSLPLKSVGYVLSFMFMSLTVLLWLELWERFPSKSGSWRLTLFETILPLTVLVVIGYWLLEFRKLWHEFLFLPIFAIILSSFSYVMKKYNLFNRVFHTRADGKKSLRYFVGIAVLLITALASILLARMAAAPLNRFLDSAYAEFTSIKP